MRKSNSYFSFIIIIYVLTSCIKDLDFDQQENFISEPIWSIALVDVNLQNSNFLDSQNNEILHHKDSLKITFLENSLIQEHLVRAEIDLNFNNEFDRNFTIDVFFFDSSGNITYQILDINIPANVNNFNYHENIEIVLNQSFLLSRKVEYELHLLPSLSGAIIDSNQIKNFKVNSYGKFHLKID